MIIYYKVGAMDEPPGKSGLAHYLEHLMFKGTENMAPGEFSARLRGTVGATMRLPHRTTRDTRHPSPPTVSTSSSSWKRIG